MNVEIREVTKNEIEILRCWRNNENVSKWFFSGSEISKEQQESWFLRYSNDASDVQFIIYHDLKAVGSVALYHIDTRHCKCEFGRFFLADNAMKGQGIGIASLELALEYAFKKLNLNRVYLEVFKDNPVAISIYKKVGFEIEGLQRKNVYKDNKFRDTYLMSILKDEYGKHS